jgi:16S rRNA (cytosine1402-N4)-methyltransferase
MRDDKHHQPVMLNECLEGLRVTKDGIYIDATFGGGGHSGAIVERLESGKLLAFDKDGEAVANSIRDKNFTLINDDFRNMKERVNQLGIEQVNGILADLGVSSHQFDSPSRGFSTRFDNEVLDMRMDVDQLLTAEDILNTYDESHLAGVFYKYGEFHDSRKIAGAICRVRTSEKIQTAGQLKNVLSSFVRGKEIAKFMARIFQALRIEVNDELGALENFLVQAAQLLVSGGRLVVISYHSLEDRMVKNYINYGNTAGTDSKDLFGNRQGLKFQAITKKPLTPNVSELNVNPRSRSGKLRVAQRI